MDDRGGRAAQRIGCSTCDRQASVVSARFREVNQVASVLKFKSRSLKYFGAQVHVFDKTFVSFLSISRSGFMTLVFIWLFFFTPDVKKNP